MSDQSRKQALAIRRQQAGVWYKVAVRLTALAALVGGIVSMFAFHAPLYIGGKIGFFLGGFLIFLIYGAPGFAPFFALYLILWYHPPQKKVQQEPPAMPGNPTE